MSLRSSSSPPGIDAGRREAIRTSLEAKSGVSVISNLRHRVRDLLFVRRRAISPFTLNGQQSLFDSPPLARSKNLCTFPVAVRGNSFTKRYSCGHLNPGNRVRSQP
jgi:hypothetical protein